MEKRPYQISTTSSLADHIGRPMRTNDCIVLYCIAGRAVAECNFSDTPFREGHMAIIFSDTLFAIKKISPGFKARYIELSTTLADESTFTSSGAFFDWVYENPVFAIPDENKPSIDAWLSSLDWIEANATGRYRELMLRNHWHNFFLGLESALADRLAENLTKSISASRKLLNGFYKLLSENIRRSHEVKFYADKLCVTPYYLSKVCGHVLSSTPKELIDRQLMMEIKSLLTSTDLTIKEIADLYNFQSTSYLGRFFRRHIGMPPSDYRAHHS